MKAAIKKMIQQQNKEREAFLKPWATKSENALRLFKMDEDIRSSFFHDIDRMIHDLSYTSVLRPRK